MPPGAWTMGLRSVLVFYSCHGSIRLKVGAAARGSSFGGFLQSGCIQCVFVDSLGSLNRRFQVLVLFWILRLPLFTPRNTFFIKNRPIVALMHCNAPENYNYCPVSNPLPKRRTQRVLQPIALFLWDRLAWDHHIHIKPFDCHSEPLESAINFRIG